MAPNVRYVDQALTVEQPGAASQTEPEGDRPAGPLPEEGLRKAEAGPFLLLRCANTLAVSGAVAAMMALYLLRGQSPLTLAVANSVLLVMGIAGDRMLRWAQRRLGRQREHMERMWRGRQVELQEIASRDDLTQLQNRRFFYGRLQEELERASALRKPLSVLMIDVDDLKAINDEFGHQVGDIVLRQFGRILNGYAGEDHVTARLGGDEFAVIMPGADRRDADHLTRQLWNELASAPLYETDHASVYVGVSVGTSGYPWGGTDLEEIIHWADTKLYANKLERKGFKQEGNGRKDSRLASAVVEVLSTALDVRDRMTHRHARRVARMAAAVARQMGLSEKHVLEIEYAAALHDIGKIGVADSILRKSAPLDEDEWKEMRRHCELGYEILKGIDFLTNAAEIVYAHHERFDATGYPRGLASEEIPLGARLFSVVDAYDAMTSRRPYRDAIPREAALGEIARNTGTQFDPEIVDTFLVVIRRSPDGFYEEAEHFGSRMEAIGGPNGDGHHGGADVLVRERGSTS